MPDPDQLALHADHIRSSEVLGRSDQLHRLFEYLVACTRAGRTPKESVIAVEVFGRGTDFDVSQDAAVRVYIHKLRRKFEEFYAAHPEVGPALNSPPISTRI
jgi:DNA-binding response OmpR family regulator